MKSCADDSCAVAARRIDPRAARRAIARTRAARIASTTIDRLPAARGRAWHRGCS